MTVDDRKITDLPESPHKRPKQVDVSFVVAKCHAWGLDPDEVAAAIAGEPAGDPLCACGEPTDDGPCGGVWRVVDGTGPVWVVECDRCGFETGVPPQDATLRAKQRMDRANLPDRFLGLAFDPDEDNKDALSLLRSWLRDFEAEQKRGKEGRPGVPAIALWGPPGVGKSHLLTSLCVKLIRERQVNVMFRSTGELLRDLQRFDNDVIRTEAWERARTVEVLALDDLGAERITDWRLEQLAELIDARYLSEKPILLTTNYPPGQWDEILDERSRDRLLGRSMVLPVQLKGRDRRQTQLGEGQ